MTLDGRGGLHRPSRGLKEAARNTPGALELPGVWLQNNPFDKGIILLLLGLQAALTAALLSSVPRSWLLEVMAVRCDLCVSPGVQRNCDAEIAAASSSCWVAPWLLLLRSLC